jgi:hypothetical protein
MISPDRYVVFVRIGDGPWSEPDLAVLTVPLALRLYCMACRGEVVRPGTQVSMTLGEMMAACGEHELMCDLVQLMKGESGE